MKNVNETRRPPVALLIASLFSCLVATVIYAEQPVAAKAFVYTELQLSAPFEAIPWQAANSAIKQQPGFINKTWLSGVGNNSVGGFYAFDSVENAQKYVSDYFPNEAKGLGVAQTTRVFNASTGAEASRGINSVYFGGKLNKTPTAFVYTEIQARVKLKKSSWTEVNNKLLQQPGLLTKTWLVEVNTETTGGFFAFDTLENAKNFAFNYVPSEAKTMKAAFYTRIFDAAKTETASRSIASPFYP